MNFNDLKKGAEEALNKTVEGAKDLADKAVDEAKKLGDSKVAQDIKKGAEDALNKTVDGAKDLADKVTDKFKKPNLNCSKLFSIKITLLMLTGNNFNTLIIPCGSGNLSRTNGKNAVIIDMTRVLNLFLSNKFKKAAP